MSKIEFPGVTIDASAPVRMDWERKCRIEVSDVKLLSDGFAACSTAFIQFSPDCPRWVRRAIAKYLDDGWVKLKTARIGE